MLGEQILISFEAFQQILDLNSKYGLSRLITKNLQN